MNQNKDKYIVSSCLLGNNCKYNGGNNYNEDLINFLKDKDYIPCCPEVLGGLSTPRISSEISGGSGLDVLNQTAKVMNKEGEDVSHYFIRGAILTFELAEANQCNKAILQSRSPSCGIKQIYNGNFENVLIDGMGVTAALLKSNGIGLIDIEDLKDTN